MPNHQVGPHKRIDKVMRFKTRLLRALENGFPANVTLKQDKRSMIGLRSTQTDNMPATTPDVDTKMAVIYEHNDSSQERHHIHKWLC